MTTETKLRESICRCGQLLFRRGLAFGSAGNISIALPEGGWLLTPTGSSLGDLDPARLSKLDPLGRLLDGDPPSKELSLHRAMYGKRPGARAVVHLHSTHAVAVSCLDGLDPSDCLPALTPYYIMRVGRLPVASYYPPGDARLAEAVEQLADSNHAILLANHGPVVAGSSLDDALYSIEEIEETAKLFLLLRAFPTRTLSRGETDELRRRFPNPAEDLKNMSNLNPVAGGSIND